MIDEQIKHYLIGHIQILLHLTLNLRMMVLLILVELLESEVTFEDNMLEKVVMQDL